jgi:hypothetical protein
MGTGIQLTAKIFPLAFIALLFKPFVEIDGQPTRGTWSTQFIPTTAGNHSITVYWKYFGFFPSNRATMQITVPEGQTVPVRYRTSWMVFLPGKIAVETAA